MSDLEEIAADANITIVECLPRDDGDTQTNSVGGNYPGHHIVFGASGDQDIISALEAEFSQRYTEADPDYTRTVEQADVLSKPPCVTNFFLRNTNRMRRRGRGGGGGGYNHHRDGGDGGYNHYRDGGGHRSRDNQDWRDRDNRSRDSWSRDRNYNSHRDGGYHGNNGYRGDKRDW